ncbi:hypothetical protein CTI12_AA203290 [Artemisia annua]|uniref:Uncharacterized protein n=1 Tax=Artemisia annua TaxID=35608 RepID=A0A2U1NBA9_ARTAN|nr:hypothetical protein CTI12_AA203290 [Artemisia annua]
MSQKMEPPGTSGSLALAQDNLLDDAGRPMVVKLQSWEPRTSLSGCKLSANLEGYAHFHFKSDPIEKP